MAEETKKKGYPKIPRANWFALRERFRQKPPTEVSASYIASALSITPASAQNIVSPLKALGLIDDANKPTDLAFEWRDDATYPAACKKMLEATYPQEVRDLFHTPDVKFKDVSNWFARSTRAGESAAGAYTSMYIVLLEADPSKAKENGATKVKAPSSMPARVPKPATTKPAKGAKPAIVVDNNNGGEHDDDADSKRKHGFSPKLHVDIQIHISPDSTPEQIDKIFESMAKHLPLKG